MTFLEFGGRGCPKGDWTSSAEMNSACGKVLPKGKTLGAPSRGGRPVAVKLTKYEIEKMFKRA